MDDTVQKNTEIIVDIDAAVELIVRVALRKNEHLPTKRPRPAINVLFL